MFSCSLATRNSEIYEVFGRDEFMGCLAGDANPDLPHHSDERRSIFVIDGAENKSVMVSSCYRKEQVQQGRHKLQVFRANQITTCSLSGLN